MQYLDNPVNSHDEYEPFDEKLLGDKALSACFLYRYYKYLGDLIAKFCECLSQAVTCFFKVICCCAPQGTIAADVCSYFRFAFWAAAVVLGVLTGLGIMHWSMAHHSGGASCNEITFSNPTNLTYVQSAAQPVGVAYCSNLEILPGNFSMCFFEKASSITIDYDALDSTGAYVGHLTATCNVEGICKAEGDGGALKQTETCDETIVAPSFNLRR